MRLLRQLFRLSCAILAICAIALTGSTLYYAVVIVSAIVDVPTKKAEMMEKYEYPAHLPNGQMLLDEKGHALLFDSRQSAAAYAGQYNAEP